MNIHSPETITRALELRKQGLTGDQIAERIGVSRGTVKDWIKPDYKRSARKTHYPIETKQRIIRLLDSGQRPYELEEATGIDSRLICTWRKQRDRILEAAPKTTEPAPNKPVLICRECGSSLGHEHFAWGYKGKVRRCSMALPTRRVGDGVRPRLVTSEECVWR